MHIELKKKIPSLLSVVIDHSSRGSDVKALAVSRGVVASLCTELPLRDASGYRNEHCGYVGRAGAFLSGGTGCGDGGVFCRYWLHNIIEPGQLGCIIFYGPVMYNFVTISADFEAVGVPFVCTKSARADRKAYGLFYVSGELQTGGTGRIKLDAR